jgi:hypothetical protein
MQSSDRGQGVFPHLRPTGNSPSRQHFTPVFLLFKYNKVIITLLFIIVKFLCFYKPKRNKNSNKWEKHTNKHA